MGFVICGILVLWEKGGEEGRNRERKVGQEPWSITLAAIAGNTTLASSLIWSSRSSKGTNIWEDFRNL